jgi:hypothetical protein
LTLAVGWFKDSANTEETINTQFAGLWLNTQTKRGGNPVLVNNSQEERLCLLNVFDDYSAYCLRIIPILKALAGCDFILKNTVSRLIFKVILYLPTEKKFICKGYAMLYGDDF